MLPHEYSATYSQCPILVGDLSELINNLTFLEAILTHSKYIYIRFLLLFLGSELPAGAS